MQPGEFGSGKHWTAAEVAARQQAEEGIKRKTKIAMRVPTWLSTDAKRIWRRVVKEAAELELFDNLDTEMLAIYCDAVSKYQDASTALAKEYSVDQEKALQAWARLVSQYADKLGMTPTARARLVKRKADEILDEFGDEFD
jgi:P27 family predicted phage terminase small subunit